MCFSFVGCNNIEKKNEEAKELLQKVLEKEEKFTYKCLVFDKVTEESLEKFMFHTKSSASNPFIPQGYTYVDLDSDGIEELLIVDMFLTYFLVLKYDDDSVNGYILEDISLHDIKTDGSFLIDRYKGYTTINRVSFDGLDYEVSDLAYKDDAANIYRLNQKSSTKEDVEEYFNDWNENTVKISWETIE